MLRERIVIVRSEVAKDCDSSPFRYCLVVLVGLALRRQILRLPRIPIVLVFCASGSFLLVAYLRAFCFPSRLQQKHSPRTSALSGWSVNIIPARSAASLRIRAPAPPRHWPPPGTATPSETNHEAPSNAPWRSVWGAHQSLSGSRTTAFIEISAHSEQVHISRTG